MMENLTLISHVTGCSNAVAARGTSGQNRCTICSSHTEASRSAHSAVHSIVSTRTANLCCSGKARVDTSRLSIARDERAIQR